MKEIAAVMIKKALRRKKFIKLTARDNELLFVDTAYEKIVKHTYGIHMNYKIFCESRFEAQEEQVCFRVKTD